MSNAVTPQSRAFQARESVEFGKIGKSPQGLGLRGNRCKDIDRLCDAVSRGCVEVSAGALGFSVV